MILLLSIQFHGFRAIFTTVAEAHTNGFREPTYYKGEYTILGKVLDAYHMEFAAIPKGEVYG